MYFHGEVEDPSKFLVSSSFFISSSELEGMPNTPLEAMCHNNILILSDIDVHREILMSNQNYLFKTRSIKNLSNKIKLAFNLSKDDFDKCLSEQIVYLNNYDSDTNTGNFLDYVFAYFQKIRA